MSLHLITGYAGEEHITSADQGAYNIGTYGDGEFVLNRGSKFAATVVSNNSISIADGEAMMQGRFIKLAIGTSEDVTIDNGTQGMNRKDLICLHYEKNSSTGIESVSLVVKKGTESSGTPSDPSYTTGDITDGDDLINEMPLYRVNLTGLTISSVDTMFSVKTSMVDYMDSYQLPVASASVLGGVKTGGEGIGLSSQKMTLLMPSGGAQNDPWTQLGGVRKIKDDYYLSATNKAKKYFYGINFDDHGIPYGMSSKIYYGTYTYLKEGTYPTINPGYNKIDASNIKFKKDDYFGDLGIPSAIQNGGDNQLILDYFTRYVMISGVSVFMGTDNLNKKVVCMTPPAGLNNIGSDYVTPNMALEVYSFEESSFSLEGMCLIGITFNCNGLYSPVS